MPPDIQDPDHPYSTLAAVTTAARLQQLSAAVLGSLFAISFQMAGSGQHQTVPGQCRSPVYGMRLKWLN